MAWEPFWNNARLKRKSGCEILEIGRIEKPDPAASGVGSIKLVSSCRRKGFAEYKVKCLQ